MNRFTVLVLGSLVAASSHSCAATFIALGYLSDAHQFSQAHDVSRDGSVVVGSSFSDAGEEAFRWTEETGMVALGDLEGGLFSSEARAVSDSGDTIVGLGTADIYSLNDAFVWRDSQGMAPVGSFEGEVPSSHALGVSSDGLMVVGGSWNMGFVWDSDSGMERLESADKSVFLTAANDISGDGSVVVGQAIVGETILPIGGRRTYPFEIEGPAIWSESGGVVPLGSLEDHDQFGRAVAVSRDGQVVVGSSGLQWKAFLWTAANGMRPIQDDAIAGKSVAASVSDAGDVVVGYYRPPVTESIDSTPPGWGFPDGLSGYGFIWTEDAGFRSLDVAIKSDYGLDLDGWIIGPAHAVSGDGKTIVGYGISPDGNRQAWLLDLSVPEPSSMALIVASVAIALGRGGRH